MLNVSCVKLKPKGNKHVYDKKKYGVINSKCYKKENVEEQHTKTYICKKCVVQYQETFPCVSCNHELPSHLCKLYNIDDYDFSQYIVSRSLPDVTDEETDVFTCQSCDKTLQKTTNEDPVVPYYITGTCLNAAANFLKCLNEKPEYVCTCCHHLLFQKTVKQFNENHYQMDNNIVKKCLSYRYRMRLKGNDQTLMEEFVWIHCKNCLQKKNPKMPDQACANGLQLKNIPQDLVELSTIEW